MTQSTHLALPYLDAAQAQKHVTHNEALQLLDALVHLSVSVRDQAAPPAAPTEGQRVLVGAGAGGGFAGKDFQIATFLAGAWTFLAPQAGWRVFVEAETLLLVYDGAAWKDVALTLRALQNLTLLGVGVTADANNPLLAKLNALLFTAKSVAEGGTGDLRCGLNKSASGGVVSQIYQTNFSGRAETGLTGDDDFHVKVSPDGAVFKEAIVVDKTTGVVTMPFTPPSGGLSLKRIEVIATSQTYVKQAGDVSYGILAIGGGGGGGSGARQAAGVISTGGGGGGPGGYVAANMPASIFPASFTITIGAGGLGGAAVGDSAVGLAGTGGGATLIHTFMTSFGGTGGGGGAAAAGGTGGFSVGIPYSTTARAGNGGAGVAGAAISFFGSSTLSAPWTAPGGGGGGISAANVGSAASAGGFGTVNFGSLTGGAAGAIGANGGAGASPTATQYFSAGGGGGGGGSSPNVAGVCGNGGAAGSVGGGGGGGGAGRNTFAGGAGGAGGAGRVVIFVYG